MMKWLLLLICLFNQTAYALVIDTPLQDAAQETRARAMFLELRCQVCEGQSVADSDAIIAQQLRKLVREKISDGESEKAIRYYLTERYGHDILFRTEHTESTTPLWVAPLGFVLLGCVILVVRRRT